MRTNNINSYKKNPDFIKFRNYVQTLLYGLEIDIAMATERNEFFEVGCYEQFIHIVKSCAVHLHEQVQMENDSYGTLFYTDYPRNYRQALEQFLEWLRDDYQITPIYYEGDLNSFTCCSNCRSIVDAMIERYHNIQKAWQDEHLTVEEDLPF